MKTKMTAVKSISRIKTESRVDEQVMKVGFVTIGLASCAIGVWSLASVVAGIVASGGPLALLGNWLKAVVG